jgi:hypothetical protein
VSETKSTNPKDAVGTGKVPFSTIPSEVIAELGLVMLEGARKYGRHNYRAAGVRASVYFDAAIRHLTRWWEGEDLDPDSGMPHLIHAMACCTVIRDSQVYDNWVDDRPPKLPDGWLAKLNERAAEIVAKYPNPVEAYTEKPRAFTIDFAGLLNPPADTTFDNGHGGFIPPDLNQTYAGFTDGQNP